MSKLEYFLNPTKDVEIRELVVSDRFKDEKGKPAKIKLKSITQAENDALIRKNTFREKNRNGGMTETFNKESYTASLMLACIVEPNFKSEEFCKAMGTADPIDALRKLFLPGEYTKITEALLELMGLDSNIGEQAKN